MDSIKGLITAHLNATKLEKEIQKIRDNIIKTYQNDTSNDLYLLKTQYAGFAAQLTKEASIFNKLLNDLEKNATTINHNTTPDIIENINIDCESSSPQDINESYDNHSVAMTDTLSIHTLQQNNDKAINLNELYNNPSPVTHKSSTIAKQTEEEQSNQISMAETKKPIQQQSDSTKQEHKMNSESHQTKRSYNNSSGQWILKTGYKYTGTGFEVFTGFRNHCKPIYSCTLLYCYETCNKNKQDLKNYLIEYGTFKHEMIKDIIFKRNYSQQYDYALIKVKGSLKNIKKKMMTLNKIKRDYDIISLFKSRRIISDTEWVYMNNRLYVTNFDIVKMNTHQNFTNLFLRYGELEEDIKMGVDSSGQPFAIICFKNLDDAKKCFELELMFGGKVLNIRFYKS